MSDIFTADQPQQEQGAEATNQAPQGNSYADQLAAIKNEKGEPKYASVEEALKGAANAQEYIRQLQAKLDEAQTAATKGTALSDVMDAITTNRAESADQQAKQLGEDEISSMFTKLLQKSEADKTKAANKQKFSDEVVKAYGDKANEFVTNKAKELGISVAILQEMAETSPVAALQLTGVGAKQSAGFNQTSSVNTATLQGNQQPAQRSYSMGGDTTKNLVAEWNRCKTLIQN